MFASQPFATQFNEQPLSVTTVKHSSLAKLEAFILAGERQQAYHYALDERLWAHALIIANGLDKEQWNEAVKEFMRSELGASPGQRLTAAFVPPAESYEGLKVAYGLFAGFGASSGRCKRALLEYLTYSPSSSTISFNTQYANHERRA
jgi:hypothetical protein